MADDIRIMVWKIKTVEVAEARAKVNITDLLAWAAKEGRGTELNDLSVEDFREYMAVNGLWATTSGAVVEKEWEDLEDLEEER